MSQIELVAIGRNEEERLRQCLKSVVNKVNFLVYIDSGSADNSLDLARNEGFNRLVKTNPNPTFVQFVDRDCKIVDSWLNLAHQKLEQQEQVAVVCGRRRERYPDQSIYNSLYDMEWNPPVGEAESCGERLNDMS